MTFDKSDFQAKFAAVVKDKGLLHMGHAKKIMPSLPGVFF
jgi:hypothetical protein